MEYTIAPVKRDEYLLIIEVWEASVRATHHFLTEEDIAYYRPLILNEYLDLVELRSLQNSDHEIVGFLGVAEGNLEMLFLHPNYRRKGLGSLMLNYSIEQLGVQQVDVNEQNPEATAFYLKNGFEVVGRSELDPQGKPYPILQMTLTK